MTKLTITSKGQITLRKEYLEHLGVGPGEKIAVEKLPNGVIKVQAAPQGDIADVFGILKGAAVKTLSIKEIGEVARDGWSGRGRRKT